MNPKRLIVAITGASGTLYGVRILEALKETDIESHLILSDAAKITMAISQRNTTARRALEIDASSHRKWRHCDAACTSALRKTAVNRRHDSLHCRTCSGPVQY